MTPLTKTQIEAMVRIRDRGPSAWCAGKGRAGGAVSRMFDRLRDLGMVEGPPYRCTMLGLNHLTVYQARQHRNER